MKKPLRSLIYCLFLMPIIIGCESLFSRDLEKEEEQNEKNLRVNYDKSTGTISIYRKNEDTSILTQHVKDNIRPYIHPIVAPDGKGILTEYQPSHHKHQTGLYWGLKMVNGRDFFMNWQGDYWRKVSAEIVAEDGQEVKWQTVYDMLDEEGNTLLTETQEWKMQENNEKYTLDLVWKGEAKTDITMGKFYVGGLFLRMPWRKGMPGEVVNADGQINDEAEQQRSMWADIGLQVEGRDNLAHIAIFDHPDNNSFPIAWRVDNELGVGPSRQILGDWSLNKGETEVIRYRLMVYAGSLNHEELTRIWKEYVCEQ
jgi:hypothetical protein